MSANIKEISRLLAQTDRPDLIEEFIESILTETEVKNVDSRWEIVKQLDKGVSQRKIASELHMSLCKITRGSKELKKENSVLKKFVKNIDQST